LDKTYPRAYLLKTQIKLAKLLIDKQTENLQAREKLFSEAVADFDLYLKYSQLEKEDYRILQKASLDFFRLYFLEKKVKTNNFKSELRILKQPKPIYPKTEKSNGVSGVVKLLVEFRADGKVGNVFVLNGINKDLDENAIAAAKSIVFKPNVSENMNVTEVRLLDFAFGVK
jgi:TonB family protein